MSISAIVTRGYGSFGTIPDVVRMGYGGAAEVATPVTVRLGAGGSSWRDFVSAEFERKHLKKELVKQKKELKKVVAQIKAVEKKVSEKPTEGILANLQRLEFRKEEIKYQISQIEMGMIPIEMFLESEIDDDDEEVMLLQ